VQVHRNVQWVREKAALCDEELIVLADGFEDAILGTVEVSGRVVVVYSTSKIVEELMQGGLSYEEAIEYFNFNIEGAYVGPYTPLYLDECGGFSFL